MAKLDFPDTPAVGDLYGSSGTVWRWDGARWASTAGASGARGRVAYAQTTVSQAGFTAPTTFNIAGLSVTYNAIAGRTYRIVAKISAQSNTANDLAQLVIALSDTGQQINGVNFALPAVNLAYGAVCEHVYTAAATSAQGIKLMYSGYVGGSSHTVYASAASPNFVSVEDITYEAGSSGNPPAYDKLPRGWIATNTNSSDYVNISTEVPVLSGQCDVVLGRKYHSWIQLSLAQSVATDIFVIQVKMGVNVVARIHTASTTAWQMFNVHSGGYTAVGTGVIPCVITVQRNSGSGLCTVGGAAYMQTVLNVYDDGTP